MGLGPPSVQQMHAWSSLLSLLVQGLLDLESNPAAVALLTSKRREATYCGADGDSFCI